MNRAVPFAILAVSVLAALPLADDAIAQSIGTLADIVDTVKTQSTTYGMLPPQSSSSTIDITFKRLVNNIDDNTFLVDGMPATVSCANEVWRLTFAKAIRPDATPTVSIRQGQSFTSGGMSGCLPPPGAPVPGNSTHSTMPLTWTPVADAANLGVTGYAVQYREGTTGEWTTFNDGTSTTASETVTGLTPSTSYEFRVAAVNRVGPGTPSASVTQSTATAAAPGAPNNLMADSYNSTAILITWDRPDHVNGGSPVAGYSLQHRVNGTSNWTTTTISDMSTSKIITGLNSTKLYNFQVAATNAAGMTGSYNDGGPGKTIGQDECKDSLFTYPKGCRPPGSEKPAAKPGVPTGFDVIDIENPGSTTDPKLTFAWIPGPKGDQTAFDRYFIGYLANTWKWACNPAGTDTTCTSGGTSGNAFNGATYLSIRAQTSDGYGDDRSAAIPFVRTPAVPGQVTGLQASSSSPPVISLDWIKPLSNGAAITDYNIYYRIGSSGTWMLYNDGTSSNTSASLNLDYGTQYQFKVLAVNSVNAANFGQGTNSTAITYTNGLR